MKREQIDAWLRKEAEKTFLEQDKQNGLYKKYSSQNSYDAATKALERMKLANAQGCKLYEMIGRLGELED